MKKNGSLEDERILSEKERERKDPKCDMLLHLINSHLDLGRKGQGYPKSLNFKCGGSYAEN
ncbi:hypothetical protein NC652_034570 [Populus alba x Populus x berolinensis]|nr:hypothetical protein NC652_034570 [Populus alba x Populus x berolinensis]